MTSSGFARVRKMGLALSGTEVSSSWGSPALSVRGKTYAVMAAHKSAESGTLLIVLPIDQRDELIEADPDTYYLKPHYVSYPSVLVRLSRIPDDALRDLLLTAWQLASKSARRRTRTRPPSGTSR
jgi:hypothetical protein